MSKVSMNPVRGHVPCPVCQTTATVHQVGEGRLLEGGELPKNIRNLGLLYYRCPECGNSSVSKRVDAYIRDAQGNATSNTQTASDKVTPPDEVTEPVTDTLDSIAPGRDDGNALSNAQTAADKVTQPDEVTGQVTDPVTELVTGDNAVFPTWGKVVLGALGLALFVWWAYRTLTPKEARDEQLA